MILDAQAPKTRAVSPGMLAVDVDGTMLRADGTLSDRVHRALHAAVDAGVHVVPSTGRPEVVAAEIVEATGLNQYWVFGNGAVTRHLEHDRLVRGFWIDQAMVVQIMSELRALLPSVVFAVEFASSLAYEAGFENVVPNKPTVPPVPDLFATLATHQSPVQKVLVSDPGLELGRLFQHVEELGGGRVVPTYSGLDFIEVAAQNVTKATALRLLADDLKLDVSEVWAVGDNHNDIEMLKWAGVGFAMGNADDQVKTAADAVLPSNDDDGVAVLIERLLDH